MADYLGYRAPDFIIAGAMKSATTSLHHLLDARPDVYVPGPELFLFDVDDWQQHPSFRFYERGRWWAPEFTDRPGPLWDWYARFFEPAAPGQMLGEDSTTYLPSRHAAQRIARLLPQTRVIVLLRDPASRCFAHYWHDVRAGRITESFEDTLRRRPGALIDRSLYKPQVERLRRHIAPDRLLMLAFEEFVAETPAVLGRVCDFLGLAPGELPGADRGRENVGVYRRWPGVQLATNRLLRPLAEDRYRQHSNPPWAPPTRARRNLLPRVVRRLHHVLNPPRTRRPPMRPHTHQELDAYFRRENEGLDSLVGFPISERWYQAERGGRG